MIVLHGPQWGTAALLGLMAAGLAVAVRVRVRRRRDGGYDPGAAWLRAGVYFAGAWAVAAATGTLATILGNPTVFDGQAADTTWVLATLGCLAVIAVGYGIVWPLGTHADGRRLVVPDTVVFGLAWGVSEGLLFASVWVSALRLLDGLPAGRVLVATATIVVISAWNGLGHALYWDVHVAPEHNIEAWNLRKVVFVHTPNLVLTTIYVTAFENLAIWVALQTGALVASAIAMRFPSFRSAPHT